MVFNVCGANATRTTYILPAAPRVPQATLNIIKAVGAVLSFLGSGTCIVGAAVGAYNPVGATVMALALAALGIILLASTRCGDSGASICAKNSPTPNKAPDLGFVPQPQNITVMHMRHAPPPPSVVVVDNTPPQRPVVVVVETPPPRPVLVTPAPRPLVVTPVATPTPAVVVTGTRGRPTVVAEIPSAASPGMNARIPVVPPGPRIVELPSSSPGMVARVQTAPTHAQPPLSRRVADAAASVRMHPYARTADRPAPPQSSSHAQVGQPGSSTHAPVGRRDRR